MDSEPSADEAEALAHLPTRVAASLFRAMLVVTLITAVLNLVSQREPAEAVRVVVGLGLTAAVVAALGYLVAERALRPAFATGLRWRRGPSRAVGVRRRLQLAWLLGSGVPLLFVLAIPLGHGEGDELPGEVPAAVDGRARPVPRRSSRRCSWRVRSPIRSIGSVPRPSGSSAATST